MMRAPVICYDSLVSRKRSEEREDFVSACWSSILIAAGETFLRGLSEQLFRLVRHKGRGREKLSFHPCYVSRHGRSSCISCTTRYRLPSRPSIPVSSNSWQYIRARTPLPFRLRNESLPAPPVTPTLTRALPHT